MEIFQCCFQNFILHASMKFYGKTLVLLSFSICEQKIIGLSAKMFQQSCYNCTHGSEGFFSKKILEI